MILECDEVKLDGSLMNVKDSGSLFNLVKYKTLWVIVKADQVKDSESLLNVIKFNFVDHHWM